jgi:uncharacterized repeat protein (TIGR01451 family)
MPTNRTRNRSWVYALFALLAFVCGAPLAHAATPISLAVKVAFSLDPVCFDDAFDQKVVTVDAGTTLYTCVAAADIFDPTAGPVGNAKVQDDLSSIPQTPNVTIVKNGSYTWVSAPFVATVTQVHHITGTGTGGGGRGYIIGPDTGTVNVVHPGLLVEKTVSTNGTCPGVETVTVLTGTQVKYCYKVTNTGDVAVNGTTVTDANGTQVTVGNLTPGQVSLVSSVFTPTATASTTAVAQGTNGTTGNQVVSAPDGATVNVIAPALTIATTVSKTGSCPGQEIVNVLVNTPVTWCYLVTNNGNATVTGVTATDDVFGAVPGAAATLAAGQSVTFSRPDISTVDTTLTASASGTAQATGTPVHSNLDPAAVNVVGPRIDIDVTVSTTGTCPGADTATVAAGTSVIYCYKVSNIGDDALSNIDVVNQDNADIGTIAGLTPGQSTTIVGGPVLVQGDAQETATATGTDPYGFGVMATDLAKVHALFPGVTIQKTVSTSGACPGSELVTVLVGSQVTYCYVVTNTGATPLTGLAVTDGGITVAVGALAPGASSSVSAPFVANAAADTAATASGTNGPTGLPVTSTPDDAAVAVVSPSLSIQKTASSNGSCPGSELVTVLSGTQVTYCYVVTNNGDTAVSNIIVTDDGASVAVGDLAPGQSGHTGLSVTATSDVDTAAVATGTATVTGSIVVSPPDDAAIDVVSPSLSIAKTVSTGGACPGSELVTVLAGTSVTYCYAVTNTGDTAISGVTVSDNGATISVGDLAAGQTGNGSNAVVINQSESTTAVASGTTTATGTPVDSAPDGAAVQVVSPALSIQKTVSTGACPGVELVDVLSGAQVTYCYTVTNTGDTAVSGVVVIDAGVTVTIGDLAPGQSGSGSGVVTVTSSTNTPAVASGTTVATGTPVSSPPDGAAVVVVNPSLSIAKTVSTGGTCPGSELVTVLSGAQVTYCYAVTNNGDTAVNGVVVSDGGATVTIGDLAPGATASGAGSVVVTASTNTPATASGTVPATGTSVQSPPDGAQVDVVHPALVIAKTVSTSGACPGSELVTVLAGTQVTYCYAVTNTGDTAVSAVSVNDNGTVVAVGDLAAGATGGATAVISAVGDTNTPAVATGTTTITGTSVSSPPDGAAIHVVTPALSIAVTVSTTGACPGQEVVNVLAGTAVTWCYAVTNTGDVAVAGVTVTDNQYGLVPGAPFALAPGASSTLSLNVSASADVTLIASAAGTVPATGTPVQSPQDPAVVNVVSPNVDIDVTVSTDGSCPGVDSVTVPAGTSVVYCYKVTNNGDDVLSDVNVVDGSQSPISELFDLAPGQVVLLAGAPVVVQGDVTISATASGTDAYGFPVTDSDTALVHALFAKLQIQKTVSLSGACPGVELVTVLPGTHATYCYLVTNSGGTAVLGVSVDDAGVVIPVGNLVPGQSAMVSDAIVATVDEDTSAIAVGTNPATQQPVQSAPDDAAVHVVNPSLSIAKTVSLSGACPGVELVKVLPGTTATYCYAVTNTGDTTIGDVSVADTGVNLPVGTLASGQTTIVSTTITAGQSDLDTFATASGTDTATWTPVKSQPDDAVIDVIHPALSIATTVSTSGACPGQEVVNVLAGTAVTWCYVVTNTGDVAVNGVGVVDDQFGTAPGGGGTLAVGQSVTLSRPMAATVDLTVTATASGTDAVLGSTVISNPDPAVVNVVHPSIDIDVTVSTNGTCPGLDAVTVPAGTSVVYCYKVTNLGDDTLTSVVVTDAANHVITTISSLASGASASYASGANVVTGDVTVTGNVSAVDQYGFPVSDVDTALVHALFADLQIVKTAPAQINGSSSGTALAFTLAVSNLGQATAVHPVVSDTLPAGTTYVSSSTTSGTCAFAGGTLTCALANLAPGAAATITVNVTVTATTGSITNTATVTSSTPDSNPSNNTSSSTTTIVGGGATRTLGFYSNHPTFTTNCLASLGGVMDIGWFKIRNEAFDNEIDAVAAGNGPDKDNRVETGISMVMGIINANVAHYTNNVGRSALEQSKMQAAKQLVTAICNSHYLGTPPSFDINAMIVAMKGTNSALILDYSNQADAFNNSGDAVSIPMTPGPANSKYPWDDPTDPND